VSDSKKLWEEVDGEIQAEPIELGRYASDDYANDPKHFAFVTSRYKFAAKMLGGMEGVMEVGCGDGFGAPIVADAVGHLICADINEPLLRDIERRHKSFVPNATYEYFDFREDAYKPEVDAIFMIDVIEHIYPGEEQVFMSNLTNSLHDHGVMLIGTPNKTAEQYASEWSRKGHINLKTQETLEELGRTYFHNVFLFGMNDEVVHTGYAPMCHFIWALCVTPKR
jgi:2-polyprenyl-3-methyl-5-hydroxy-6-metoxy-1,4-benzoquinol methylase